jgi:uncharacterized protein
MDGPLITVRGEAQLEGPPDRAGISVTVHATGAAAEAVRAELADASQRIRARVDSLGAALAELRSTGLHLAPVFSGRAGTKITGYRGQVSAEVVVGDLDALSDVLHALGSLPQAQLDGPWWSLRPDHPLHREARLTAVADARRRAEDYAAAVGGTVGEVLEISDLEPGLGGPRPLRMARAMAGEADQPDFDLEPAVQRVSGSITVRFRLRPAP